MKRHALYVRVPASAVPYVPRAVAPQAPAAEWMMGALRAAVAEAGVREVHHKLVVLGERGESPPGFTAAVLVDVRRPG